MRNRYKFIIKTLKNALSQRNLEKEAYLVADWRASKLETRRKLAAIDKIQVTLREGGQILLHMAD